MRRAAGRIDRSAPVRCVLPVLLLLASAVPGRAAAPALPRCDHVGVSPAFAKDRTVFCAGIAGRGSSSPVGVFYVSGDGGRSWAKAAARGLEIVRSIGGVVVSPLYASDRAVYVPTGDGVFVTTDRGATFALVDALANDTQWDVLVPFVTTVQGLPTQPVPRVNFAWSHRTRNARLDPPVHQPVSGAPDAVAQFLLPPGFDITHDTALATASRTAAGTLQPVVWKCLPNLVCTEPLHEFAAGNSVVHAWLAPDYAKSRTVFVVTRPFPGGRAFEAWRSTDGGATFAPWTSLMAVLKPLNDANPGGRASVTLAFGPGASEYYVRVSYPITKQSPPAPPANQVLRSTNAGRTWTRVAWSMGGGQRGPKGALPWFRGAVFSNDAVAVAPDGRLFTVAANYDDELYCSVDKGRTWARLCRR